MLCYMTSGHVSTAFFVWCLSLFLLFFAMVHFVWFKFLLLLFKDRIIALIACMCKSKHIQQNKGKYCPISIELSAQEACPVCRESGVCKLFAEISYRLFCTLHRLLIDWYATSQLTAQEPYLLIGMNNQAFCHQNINGRTPDSMVLITVIP